MSTRTLHETAGATVTGTEVLERCRQLQAMIDEHAAADPWASRLADPVTEAVLHDTGLLRLWLPRSVGGGERPTHEMIDVIEELSYADGATGWVALAAVLATTGTAAYCGDEAVAELFGGPRLPVVEGSGAAAGVAEVVPGGYRLTGAWSYGSGVKHASHVYAGAVVHEDGAPRLGPDGEPEVLLTVTPRDDVTFGDNWDVVGLRATGSIDYRIDDVFVPEAFAHDARTRRSARGGALYDLGVIAMGTLLHGAWALGVSRRALDELGVYAVGRGDRSASDDFTRRAALAHAKHQSSVAYLYGTWRDVQDTLDGGHELSTRQLTNIRLAVRHVTDVTVEICTFAFRASSGVGLRAGAIQRCFRDASAAGQHLVVSDLIARACGREVLGLAEGHVWKHAALVPAVR